MYDMQEHDDLQPSNIDRNHQSSNIRKLAGYLAALIFLADMILLVVLIATLLGYALLASAQPVPIQFLLILIIYVFGLGLFIYGRPAFGDMFDGIIYLFIGWPYILLAAGLLAVVSLRFVTNFDLSLGFLEFLLYAFAVSIISTFGVLISRIVNEPIKHFAVPFLLITFWQISLWVWRILSDKGVPAGWNLAGSLFLFIFTVIFIVSLLRESEALEDDELD